MADFVAVLKKTIDGLGETTPETRQKVYEKARATIAAKLAQIDPPPSPTAVDRQKKALEDAIAVIEAEYAPKPATPEPADELDEFFASLSDAPAKEAESVDHGKPEPSPETSEPIPSALAVEKQEPAHEPPPSGLAGPASVSPPSDGKDEFDFDHPGMTPPLAPKSEIPRKRSRAGLFAALVVLLVIAGAAYGAWMKRAELAAKLGVDLPQFAKVEEMGSKAAPPAAKVAKEKPAPSKPKADTASKSPASAGEKKTAAANPAPQKPAGQAGEAVKPAAGTSGQPSSQPTVQKFTERLLPDGTETNPGPAGGEAKVGEGSSVAAATTAPAPAQPNSTDASAPAGDTTQIPVGQHAIFYEERTETAQGSAQNGSVVWSLVKESPGGDAPPEPAIRAEANIPGKDVQLRMTIRRNTDQTLPASHIIELIFLTPDHFEGGGIQSVLRIAMKDTEQSPGSPLLGIPAKISDGFFLFALNNDKAAVETNLNLLRQQRWIDIPLVYKSGRRALITLEKGIPGNKVFDEALKAWAQLSSSDSG